jgi:hypothetical protein
MNWPCHLFTMQVSRHDQIQMLLSLSGCCKLSKLVLPSVYCSGVKVWPSQNASIIIEWLTIIGIGHASCLPYRFPVMIKSKCWYHYLVVATDRNRPCHLITMQVSKHGEIQHVLLSSGGCKLSELLLPFIYYAGLQA